MRQTVDLKCLLKRKIATLVLVTASFCAFATLGDGGKKGQASGFSAPAAYSSKNFSLRSGYNFRSNNLFTSTQTEGQLFRLNTVITYQKGNSTFILPLKKRVILDKIKFNPAR
jgi:hypothetical protein